jgi:hypothetical protein
MGRVPPFEKRCTGAQFLSHRPPGHKFGYGDKKLTVWSRLLLENLIVAQLVKNSQHFMETWRFITVIKSPQVSLSWARLIQSTSTAILLTSILVVSSYLRLGVPSVVFSLSLCIEILHAFLFCLMSVICLANLVLFHFAWRGVQIVTFFTMQFSPVSYFVPLRS